MAWLGMLWHTLYVWVLSPAFSTMVGNWRHQCLHLFPFQSPRPGYCEFPSHSRDLALLRGFAKHAKLRADDHGSNGQQLHRLWWVFEGSHGYAMWHPNPPRLTWQGALRGIARPPCQVSWGAAKEDDRLSELSTTALPQWSRDWRRKPRSGQAEDLCRNLLWLGLRVVVLVDFLGGIAFFYLATESWIESKSGLTLVGVLLVFYACTFSTACLSCQKCAVKCFQQAAVSGQFVDVRKAQCPDSCMLQ